MSFIRKSVVFFMLCLVPAASVIVFIPISYLLIDSWLTDLLGFAIPFLLLYNATLLLFILIFTARKKYCLIPLAVLLAGFKPAKETLSLSFKFDRKKSDFSVVSFNIASFNTARMTDKISDSLFNAAVYDWLREKGSPDILCIQEFFHSDLADNDNALDSISMIGGYKYYYVNPVYVEDYDGIFGVITFSKYPALSEGEVKYSDDVFNKGIFHDFIIKGDTVRIFNLHLKSMSIRWNSSDTLPFIQRMKYNANNIYEKLREGYLQRKIEFEEIEKYLDNTARKTIICADINALPYSFTYQNLKKRYDNAFEKAGTGFGITYHHFPWFIRIDNQFFDNRLKIDYYKTHRSLNKSDHYPIEAGYSFR